MRHTSTHDMNLALTRYNGFLSRCRKRKIKQVSQQNRPLEFRAFHVLTKTLFEVSCLSRLWVFGKETGTGFPREECIIMQFTGLYDSQGVKVFEGDILYSYYPNSDQYTSAEFWRIVCYRNGCFIELRSNEEPVTWHNLEPMLNTDQDRVVNCYYLQPELLLLNTEYGTVPASFD